MGSAPVWRSPKNGKAWGAPRYEEARKTGKHGERPVLEKVKMSGKRKWFAFSGRDRI